MDSYKPPGRLHTQVSGMHGTVCESLVSEIHDGKVYESLKWMSPRFSVRVSNMHGTVCESRRCMIG